jgi:hypothetical protein
MSQRSGRWGRIDIEQERQTMTITTIARTIDVWAVLTILRDVQLQS